MLLKVLDGALAKFCAYTGDMFDFDHKFIYVCVYLLIFICLSISSLKLFECDVI